MSILDFVQTHDFINLGRTEAGNAILLVSEADYDLLRTLAARLAEYDNVIIPSWKREEEMWREDEANAIEFRRVLAEELTATEARLAEAMRLLAKEGIHMDDHGCWCNPTVIDYSDDKVKHE